MPTYSALIQNILDILKVFNHIVEKRYEQIAECIHIKRYERYERMYEYIRVNKLYKYHQTYMIKQMFLSKMIKVYLWWYVSHVVFSIEYSVVFGQLC